MSRVNRILDKASQLGVKIIIARTAKDRQGTGVHLLNPSLYEIETTLGRPNIKEFKKITIHTHLTWGLL